jgi:hypothetical protein
MVLGVRFLSERITQHPAVEAEELHRVGGAFACSPSAKLCQHTVQVEIGPADRLEQRTGRRVAVERGGEP